MTNDIPKRILALLEVMASIQVLIDEEIVRADSDWLYDRADPLHREIMALKEAIKPSTPCDEEG